MSPFTVVWVGRLGGAWGAGMDGALHKTGLPPKAGQGMLCFKERTRKKIVSGGTTERSHIIIILRIWIEPIDRTGE
jgi:hypothetical protein